MRLLPCPDTSIKSILKKLFITTELEKKTEAKAIGTLVIQKVILIIHLF